MKKNKINVYKLATRNEHTGCSKENVIEQDDPLEPNNATIDNKNEQFFEMRLETDAIIGNLATLTIYNWRSADTIDSLTFLTTSSMWNSIGHANNNGESFTLYYYVL